MTRTSCLRSNNGDERQACLGIFAFLLLLLIASRTLLLPSTPAEANYEEEVQVLGEQHTVNPNDFPEPLVVNCQSQTHKINELNTLEACKQR